MNNINNKNVVKVHDYGALHYCINKNTIAGCGYCKANFEEDDLAYALETGKCQYCRSILDNVLTK